MRRDAAAFGASVALAAMVTAGDSWVTVLVGWVMGVGIWCLIPSGPMKQGRLGAGVTIVYTAVLSAVVLIGAEHAFPEDGTYPFLSVCLLGLLWRGLMGEKRTPGTVANLLGILLLPVFGVILLFGFGDISWEAEIPEQIRWERVLPAVVTTMPWWPVEQRDQTGWRWFGASAVGAVGLSVLTRGILGNALTEWEQYPLYRAVQTIRILGVLQRFEALLAAAVLMGAFGILLNIGQRQASAVQKLFPKKPHKIIFFGICVVIFLLEWGIRSIEEGVRQRMEPAFWGTVILLTLGVVVFGKIQKNKKKC